jgi:hypothetical protein
MEDNGCKRPGRKSGIYPWPPGAAQSTRWRSHNPGDKQFGVGHCTLHYAARGLCRRCFPSHRQATTTKTASMELTGGSKGCRNNARLPAHRLYTPATCHKHMRNGIDTKRGIRGKNADILRRGKHMANGGKDEVCRKNSAEKQKRNSRSKCEHNGRPRFMWNGEDGLQEDWELGERKHQ